MAASADRLIGSFKPWAVLYGTWARQTSKSRALASSHPLCPGCELTLENRLANSRRSRR
jgi:hypothetical protein